MMTNLNEEVNKALAIVAAGGVILYPTDTVWGLGCDAANEAAVKRIFEIKERAESKSLVMLLPDVKSVFNFVADPYPDLMGLLQSFDSPTTVIYPQAIGIASNALPADGSVAIRITSEPFCKTLLKRLKKPLVSTSANISGSPAPGNFSEITREVKSRVDYIVNYRQDELIHAQPSKIVKIAEDGSLLVIRP
jgi:L-threonylcarbamoyladenylate synthase